MGVATELVDGSVDVAPSPGEPPPPRARRRQWTAALLANLAAVCAGTAVAWTSPTLPVLQGEDDVGAWAGSWATALRPSKFLTETEGAVVAALVPLGALVGALPSGMLARRLGCRRPLLALGPLFAIGWMLILLAGPAGIGPMLAGRALHGVATGGATVLVPLYCEEVAEVAIRGALGALLDLSMCNGVLLAYVLALGMPYALLTLVCACVPLIFAATFIFMPESPVYLAHAGQQEEALTALTWLRPGWSSGALQKELATLMAHEPTDDSLENTADHKEHDQQVPASSDNVPTSSRSVSKLWPCGIQYSSIAAKGIFISYSLMFLQQVSAISAVIAYSTQIFVDAGSSLSPRRATVVLGTLQSVGGVVAAMTVEHAGRRLLLVCSSSLVCAMLLAMAVADPAVVPWLPVVALGIYIFAFELGIGPLPWFITAELVGPTASGGAVALNWATAAAVTQFYPALADAYGQRPVFGAFAVMAGVAAVFSLTLVPETRGKTRAQLRREMERWPRRPLEVTDVVKEL